MSSILFVFLLAVFVIIHNLSSIDAFQWSYVPSPSINRKVPNAPSFVPFGHRPESPETIPQSFNSLDNQKYADAIRQKWIDSSLQYYSKVMKEERRRSSGQLKEISDPKKYIVLAKKHYFALRKIKDGRPNHAEKIYRKIINELFEEQRNDKIDECDHSKIAVTTLLLALHLQRNNANPRKTRSVFLNFFRIVTQGNDHEECACSAKVLQAFALFEMKQGNSLKSLDLILAAIKLDPTLKSILNWTQFRQAMKRREANSFQADRLLCS